MPRGLSTNLKPEQPRRRRLRLPEYDYAQAGAYFVTICTRDHACLFGRVLEGKMQPNAAGEAAVRCWDEIPRHFPHVELDAFVVMPNHVHGVLLFEDQAGDTGEPARAGHARPRKNRIRPVPGAFSACAARSALCPACPLRCTPGAGGRSCAPDPPSSPAIGPASPPCGGYRTAP